MRTGVSNLGLGEIRGDYSIISPAVGSAAQVLRGFLVLLWIVMLGVTAFNPSAVDGNIVGTTAVVAAVYALKFGWRWLTARLGVNRCYLCTHGVAVTNRFGRIRDSVVWSEVTGVHQMAVVGLVMGANRIEIFRSNSAKPLWFVAPGAKSALVQALLDEARRRGALR